MKISIQSFKGVSPRINPRYLPESMAQVCQNAEAIGWSLKPYSEPDATTDSVSSLAETLYRYNAQGTSPQWLAFDSDVDIVKGQIANDTEEWTHFTGENLLRPKSTYASIVSNGPTNDAGNVDLGVERPSSGVGVSVVGAAPPAEEGEIPETRVYVVTYLRELAGLTVQSRPSPASSTVTVYPSTQTVDVTFPSLPSSSEVTGFRLYRSAEGEYLYVSDYANTDAGTTVNDAIKSDSLGEVLPSLDWSAPPDDLTGLVNMPNGVVAGFVGRDVYFSEPYRPYAWPEKYMQSLDYDVVGFGVLDTTLVVLTTGEPYTVQGSTPDAMVVVKGQQSQACVSKRSIISAQGAVFYASPDGLMQVSTSGTSIVTWEKFDATQWQELNPSSFKAFFNEDKYIAFYNNGTETGAFVYDLRTGEVSFSGVYAEAGFRDLFDDSLYIKPPSTGALSKWREGSTKQTAVWRSKKFTMPKWTCFGWGHVEAENYPVTCRVYVDDALVHTQTVTSRSPFRLPAIKGKDWEIEIETTKEVFALMLAQSSQELAGG